MRITVKWLPAGNPQIMAPSVFLSHKIPGEKPEKTTINKQQKAIRQKGV